MAAIYLYLQFEAFSDEAERIVEITYEYLYELERIL